MINDNKFSKGQNENKEMEIYENLDTDDNNEELLKRKKNKNSVYAKIKLIYILTVILMLSLIILLIYTNKKAISDNYESNKKEEKMKSPEISIEYIHVINNTNEYSNKDKFPFTSISKFPSGNLISTDSISIFIYDNNYNIVQKISVFELEKGSIYRILSLDVKDDDNFAIGCNEQSIKIYKREKEKGNIFVLKQDIKNAHDRSVTKVIYNSFGNIISCSYDKTIKIWELGSKGDFINKKIIKSEDEVRALLLLEDKNLLVSSGERFTNIWEIQNGHEYKLIKTFNETYCRTKNVLERISDDIIIVSKSPSSLKVISLSQLKAIKIIEFEFGFNSLKYVKGKDIFLVGGYRNEKKDGSSTIKVIRSDNFEEISTIYDTHKYAVEGFCVLKDGSIASYSYDYVINIWSIKNL